MSLRYMLDTSACVDVLRTRNPVLKDRFNSESDTMAISTIVLMELLVGAEKNRNPSRIRFAVEDFASRLRILPFDEDAADHAARVRALLEAGGQMIGGFDLLIAGHARSRGLTLVTGNLREFQRVPGLLSENWQ